MEWKTGHSYAIVYLDGKCERTQRTVDVLAVDVRSGGMAYLRCNCHLRGEERSFRTDRIVEARPVAQPRVTFPEPPLSLVDFQNPAPVVRDSGASKARGGGFLKTLMFCVGALIGLGIMFPNLDLGGLAGGALDTGAQGENTTSRSTAASTMTPSNAPRNSTVVDERIGGRTIRSYRNGQAATYTVLENGFRFQTKTGAVRYIRGGNFRSATGIEDAALVERYMAADQDGSGKLSFAELEAFQKVIYRGFRYQNNDYALRPDRFLAAGGGDCEDFALYTAGLLRFWGWEPYIASFAPSGYGSGHAVCFSYEAGSFPSTYSFYTISSWTADDGSALKPGRYIPIDYELVGGLTDAVGKGWKLRDVYRPEAIYGMKM